MFQSNGLRALVVLGLAMGVGLIVPTITYAAGPAQTGTVDTGAALNALIALVITAVSGGAVALLLDDVAAWKNWDNPGAKTFLVLLVNAAIGAGLLAAQPYIPSFLETLPAPLVVFLGFFVSYLVNQFSHQADAKFSAWKTAQRAGETSAFTVRETQD